MTNDDIPSKSARKRDATALQKLALKLSELNAKQLLQVPVSDKLAQALSDYARFPSRGARRRQAQFLGKLMRTEDIVLIEQSLAIIENTDATTNYHHHQAEVWRDRLTTTPGDITEFINLVPQCDRQQIKNLLRKIQKSKTEEQAKPVRRELYRVIFAEFSGKGSE